MPLCLCGESHPRPRDRRPVVERQHLRPQRRVDARRRHHAVDNILLHVQPERQAVPQLLARIPEPRPHDAKERVERHIHSSALARRRSARPPTPPSAAARTRPAPPSSPSARRRTPASPRSAGSSAPASRRSPPPLRVAPSPPIAEAAHRPQEIAAAPAPRYCTAGSPPRRTAAPPSPRRGEGPGVRCASRLQPCILTYALSDRPNQILCALCALCGESFLCFAPRPLRLRGESFFVSLGVLCVSAVNRSSPGERSSTSPSTIVTFIAPAKRSCNPAIRSRSTSTATTRRARSASTAVSAPSPGPTSNTVSPGAISAASTMRVRMLISERKCWPKRFFARTGGRDRLREDVDVDPLRLPVNVDSVREPQVDDVSLDRAARVRCHRVAVAR